jgi:hypothetical protein
MAITTQNPSQGSIYYEKSSLYQMTGAACSTPIRAGKRNCVVDRRFAHGSISDRSEIFRSNSLMVVSVGGAVEQLRKVSVLPSHLMCSMTTSNSAICCDSRFRTSKLDMPASATGWSEPVLQARVAPAEIQRLFSAHFIAK